MRHAVILDIVAAAHDLAAQIRMFCGKFADAKEGRLCPVTVEDIQHLRRDFRIGAVVNGDGHFAVAARLPAAGA